MDEELIEYIKQLMYSDLQQTEYQLTLDELINLGYNVDILEDNWKGIYTEQELVEILLKQKEQIFTTTPVIPKTKKEIIKVH